MMAHNDNKCNNKKKFHAAILIGVTVLFTLTLAILLSPSWTVYEGGNISLWSECRVVVEDNHTQSDERHCKSTISKGPAFLNVCRTMMCFAAAFYFLMFYACILKFKNQPTANKCKALMKAKLPFISLFVSGALVLTATLLYDKNYYDHYSENGKERQDVRGGSAVWFGFLLSTLTLLLALAGLGSEKKKGVNSHSSSENYTNVHNSDSTTQNQLWTESSPVTDFSGQGVQSISLAVVNQWLPPYTEFDETLPSYDEAVNSGSKF